MTPRWFPIVALVCLVACGRGAGPQGAPGGGPGAMPPMPVKIVSAAARPVPRTSEFVATIRSLRSTTIQPQAEGIVTRIFVKSGDRVKPGQPLAQIDPDKQLATVGSLESSRAARQADVAYAKQQLDRMQTLLDAGAVSRQELEQAQTAYKTAQAQLEALEAQIRAGRVELQYYRVTAPTAGVIGDIPVRVGDRVQHTTAITTIDGAEGLEVYVNVPLEEASGLRLGLPVELLDQEGTVTGTYPITFVAPRADDATQSVLAKAQLRAAPESLRVLQYVRARIVWSTEPSLTVPVVAVNRVGGAYFCFVAEPQAKGFVARQRPLQLGELRGEEYVVRAGLKPGDRVIVTGVQKLGDGAPVQPEA
jgi:RND family efflux transporter MFP subunit